MTTEAEADKLIRDAIVSTGAAAPALLEEDSSALRETPDGGIYLTGLIGGKDVGKSALVNALAGAEITEQSSHGPGTEDVIAYVHKIRAAELKALLQREAPGRHRIVTHENPRLRNQVLLDLPDIDSRFDDHVDLTRRMLRRMLFPIWMQSVEKYADESPRKLLAAVAAGNDPANFIFCLNKCDQLPAGEAEELRGDFAGRLANSLGLLAPPQVYMISAIRPQTLDFPELSRHLSREKTPMDLAESRRLAARRRLKSLLAWLDEQDLIGRAGRLARLQEEAEELLSHRVGQPLIEGTVPGIRDDPSYRLVMADGVFSRRVARWPIVNVLHAVLSPLRLLVRENASAGSFFGGAEALVDAHLAAPRAGIASLVQSVFAQLNQSNATIATLYARRKLWETMDASAAESRLRADLIETVEQQRQAMLERLSGQSGAIAPILRMLLTIGALLWFPIIQPVLHTILAAGHPIQGIRDGAILLVDVLSGEALLKNAAFLLFGYLLIWSLLRWNTRRRVEKLLDKWKNAENPDPSLNLSARAMEWLDDLLEPIHSAKQTADELAARAEALRKDLDSSAAKKTP